MIEGSEFCHFNRFRESVIFLLNVKPTPKRPNIKTMPLKH